MALSRLRSIVGRCAPVGKFSKLPSEGNEKDSRAVRLAEPLRTAESVCGSITPAQFLAG